MELSFKGALRFSCSHVAANQLVRQDFMTTSLITSGELSNTETGWSI